MLLRARSSVHARRCANTCSSALAPRCTSPLGILLGALFRVRMSSTLVLKKKLILLFFFSAYKNHVMQAPICHEINYLVCSVIGKPFVSSRLRVLEKALH